MYFFGEVNIHIKRDKKKTRANNRCQNARGESERALFLFFSLSFGIRFQINSLVLKFGKLKKRPFFLTEAAGR